MHSKKSIRAILFDLDGTLLDSRDFYLLSFQKMMSELAGIEVPFETALANFGLAGDEYVRKMAPADRADELVARWGDYLALMYDDLKLYPGIRSVLFKMKNAGLQIGVVTSQLADINQSTRQMMDIDHLIDTWVIAYEAGANKPDPAPVQLALQRLNVSIDQAVMIGDTVFDVLAGQRAGVRVGAVLWGANTKEQLLQYHPDYLFNRAEELLELIPAIEGKP